MDSLMKNWVAINAPYGTEFTVRPNKKSLSTYKKYDNNSFESLISNYDLGKSKKSLHSASIVPPETVTYFNSNVPTQKEKSNTQAKEYDRVEKAESSSNKSLTDKVSKNVESEEKTIPSESLSLDAMVNLKLQTSPSKQIRLPEIYRELSIFDPDLTGFANESQFTLLAMKYELPLKVSTIRSLCRNFSDEDRPHLVNYFKLLKFLASCLPLPDSELSGLAKNRSAINSYDLKTIMDSYPVSDKVVSLLKDQLKDSGYWDISKLFEALLLADRYNDKHLPAETVLNVCMSQRVPLTSSLLIKLLQLSEIEVGVVDWRAFLSPIVHACASTSSSQSSWRLNDKELNECMQGSCVSVEKLKSSTGKNQDAKWKRNFSLLSLALKSHNPYETDRVPRAVIERMLSNYNIVYELNYSQTFMENAIDQAVVDKKSTVNETLQLVSVERLLNILGGHN